MGRKRRRKRKHNNHNHNHNFTPQLVNAPKKKKFKNEPEGIIPNGYDIPEPIPITKQIEKPQINYLRERLTKLDNCIKNKNYIRNNILTTRLLRNMLDILLKNNILSKNEQEDLELQFMEAGGE